MKSLAQVVSELQVKQYFNAKLAECGADLLDTHLLDNGARYSAEIARHWWKTCFTGIKNEFNLAEPHLCHKQNDEALLDMPQLPTAAGQMPLLMRYVQHTPDKRVQLVALHMCAPARAMEKYYKLQRERKIWWMRISYNPSRYFMEAHDSPQEHSQCITLKSRISFVKNAWPIEHISLLPLHKMNLQQQQIEQHKLQDERSGKHMLPNILKSVTDLSLATQALLLDGCDHGRGQTLMLHRKIAPFQLSILAYGSDTVILYKLMQHLKQVLQQSHLRVYNNFEQVWSEKQQLATHLDTTDGLGIPYVLIINDETLDTGLLALRSRDTTLAETIHISDISTYLPNIFTH